MNQDSTSKIILRKMINHNITGGRHNGVDDLKRGFPSHERGNVEKTIKNLAKKNLILKHPTSYGMQYSLNHDMLGKIRRILECDEPY